MPTSKKALRILAVAGFMILFGIPALRSAFMPRSSEKTTPPETLAIDPQLHALAREMAPGGVFEVQKIALANDTSTATLLVVEPAGLAGQRLISTRNLANVHGFGGPLSLAVRIDADGTLHGIRYLESRETPAYQQMTQSWMADLTGRSLSSSNPFGDVDTVTGATVTSAAVLEILDTMARLWTGYEPPIREIGFFFRIRAVLSPWMLAIMMPAALFVRRMGAARVRRVFLLAGFILLGLLLQAQFSLSHILDLAGGRWPAVAFNLSLLLPLIVALTPLVGNLYCGYLCPFGACQELIGDLRPAPLSRRLPSRHPAWRLIRAPKYIILTGCILALAWQRDPAVITAWDPLTNFMSRSASLAVQAFGLLMLAATLLLNRFWCRALCPTGAFIALLNGIRIIRPTIPKVYPGHCDLGVARSDELDCLHCRRCDPRGASSRLPAGANPEGLQKG